MPSFDEYQEGTTSTFKQHEALTPHQARLLDWTTGLAGETGEVSELIKHHVFHGEPLDKMKLAKELGDVLWYVSAMAKSNNIPLEACAELNLAKLAHRHRGAFSEEASHVRHAREEAFESTVTYLHIKNLILGDEEHE